MRYLKTISLVLVIVLQHISTIIGQHSLVKYDFPVNSDQYDEICPVLTYDEDKIFITRIGSPDFNPKLLIDSVDVYEIFDEEEYKKAIAKVYKQIASKEIHDVIASSFNQDIWTIILNKEKKPIDFEHPGYPLNNALPNSICSRFDNHNRFIIINQFDEIGGLDKGFSFTQMKGEEFTFPKAIEMDGFHVKSGNVNITCSSDQKILILSMPDDEGNMDLYLSERLYDMYYSKPLKLSTDINSPFNEITPFLSQDQKTLYFSSDRLESRGGTDIFKASRIDDTFLKWENVEPLLPPVNSEKDEMYPTLFDNETKLLFSSDRDGSFDIFQASLKRDKNISVDIEITIINGETLQKMPAELYWGLAYEPVKNKENYFRCRDGKYTLKIAENKPVVIHAMNRNLSSQEYLFDPQELWSANDKIKKVDLILNPENTSVRVVRETKVETLPFLELLTKKEQTQLSEKSSVFKNIMFEKSTAIVLPQSFASINSIGKFLKINKNIIIEILGHTDNIGEPEALQKLSLERAIAIKNILVSQGIESNRIIPKGFGDKKPLNDNSSEVLRRKNRRVEIRIVRDVEN
ncbi:MAG: OmpA family protein [Saprospiraceae bacterium]|nr:OmpA family protein [Saprospiraceae bacterium]MBK8372191.1 OmpA family protein [Saprospiraceae bacterium]MBK8853036.1 OmpA family protein [Saprospiraceae bacterium]